MVPCEEHALLGLRMAACARWRELQGEIAPSRMEPAISHRAEESGSVWKPSQARAMLLPSSTPLGEFNLLHPRRATWKTLQRVKRSPLPSKEEAREKGGK